jgi:hypothetical protein
MPDVPAVAAASVTGPTTSNRPVTTTTPMTLPAAAPVRDPARWNCPASTPVGAAAPARDRARLTRNRSSTAVTSAAAREARRDPGMSRWSTCSGAAEAPRAQARTDPATCSRRPLRTRRPSPDRIRPTAAGRAAPEDRSGRARTDPRRCCRHRTPTARGSVMPVGRQAPGRTDPATCWPDRSSPVRPAPIAVPIGPTTAIFRPQFVWCRAHGPNGAAGQYFSYPTNHPKRADPVAGDRSPDRPRTRRSANSRPARGGSDDAGTSGPFASGRDRATGSPRSSRPLSARRGRPETLSHSNPGKPNPGVPNPGVPNPGIPNPGIPRTSRSSPVPPGHHSGTP